MTEDIEHLLDGVDRQPNGADPTAVRDAIRRLRGVSSHEESEAAYNEVLDLIAHNHSGWLYPAAGPVASVLAAITREARGLPRRTALDILVDCLCWARPEQRYTDSDGRDASVRDAVRDAVESVQPGLSKLVVEAGPAVPVTDLLHG